MFRAYDPDRERLVAVKHFRLDLPPERVHRLAAELEGLIAAAPNHPAIVAPLAAGIEGVTAYLAEEYVAAESLDVMLRQQRQASVRDSLRVAAQLAGALEAAADAEIHHGAIHPRDVLLTADDTKLTGLGIAQALEVVGITPPLRRPYTAPEQAEKAGWDRRVDVFALTAIAYEMLWGRRVSGTGRDVALSLADPLGGDLGRLREVFERGLAEDPLARFDSPFDFAEALTAAFSTRLIPLADEAVIASLAPIEQVPAAPSTSPATMTPAVSADEIEPRLPLDLVNSRDDVAEELPLFSHEPAIGAARPPSPDDALASETVSVPVILEPLPEAVEATAPAAAVAAVADLEPRLKRPGMSTELPDVYQAVPETAGRTRAISPLAFALVIGIALGFAAGFAVGIRRPGAVLETSATTTVDQAAATTGATADAVDGAVAGAPPPAAVPDRSQPRPPQEPAPQIVGSLLVRSTPAGARVFVDGRDYGVAPVTVSNLSRGTHRVRVTHNGYVTEEQQLTITPAQQTHSVTVRLSPQPPATAKPAPPASVSKPASAVAAGAELLTGTGTLSVDSRPVGARVFVDGKLVGTTPVVLRDVAAGDHAVHLELEGYQRWATAVRVVPSESNRVAASLDR